MIEDLDHPEMKEAHRQLMVRLNVFTGMPLTVRSLEQMKEAVKDHRTRWRLKGVDFPQLIPICIMERGIVHWSRADLDVKSIQQTVLNFVHEYHEYGLTMADLVKAFHAAFPNYHVDLVRQQFMDFKPKIIKPH